MNFLSTNFLYPIFTALTDKSSMQNRFKTLILSLIILHCSYKAISDYAVYSEFKELGLGYEAKKMIWLSFDLNGVEFVFVSSEDFRVLICDAVLFSSTLFFAGFIYF